jgi:hypothetical protein
MNSGQTSKLSAYLRQPIAIAVLFALCKLLLFVYIGNRYGYFRDEMYFLACADHLAWGYPDHAPLSIFLANFSRNIFGDSLHAIRLFPELAGALRIIIAGLIVKEFGGKYIATLIACLAVFAAPGYLAIDNLMSMNSYESIFWMGCVLSYIWAVRRDDPNYWLLFGTFAGLGLMNKHSMVFFGAAFVTGLLLTKDRKSLAKPQFWPAGAIAFVIFLPNFVWQYQNDWATLELLQNVRNSGKNVAVSPVEFLLQQLLILNPVSAPVLLAGLWALLFGSLSKKFRSLGITFVLLYVLMTVLKAKNYYLGPIYPFMFAAGGVFLEGLALRGRFWKPVVCIYAMLIPLSGAVVAPLAVPILPVEKYNKYVDTIGISPPKTEVAHKGLLPQHFGDMFGWKEMVAKTSSVYNSLPEEERRRTAILAGDYGDAGAIDLFGKEYGLPRAISAHQSYYLWGYRDFDGRTAILLDFEKDDAERMCGSVEERDRVGERFSMAGENYTILVCRDIKLPIDQLWKRLKHWN